VFSCGFVVPVEGWLLEATVEAAEVNVEKHGDSSYLAGLTEFKEVILEELVTFHSFHHTSTTLGTVFLTFNADDN
jgi:hypothetical protein